MSDRMTRTPGAASGSGISAGRAVLIGHLWCSVPSTLLFVGAIYFSGILTHPESIQYIPLLVGVIGGWVWWANMMPRWRQWAQRRGAPAEATRKLANRTLLSWPTEEDLSRRPRTRR